jgi:endonuclease G
MKNLIIALVVFITSGLTAQEFDYLPTSTTDQIINHSYYSVSYSPQHKLAEWVAYKLTPEMVNGQEKPIRDYKADPKVSSGMADLSDYKNSGYVKAHLAPVADMQINQKALAESFYFTNVSPQSSAFNTGIWKNLEEKVRSWVLTNGEVYVVTGGILNNNKGHFGANRVSIPGEYYKVILDTEPEYKVIGFMMTNAKGYGKLKSYAVSVDDIETITGIDFFPSLPDGIEEEIEAEIDLDYWTLNVNSSASSNSAAVQCKGIGRTSEVRCKNKTTNPNGYCKLHQGQASDTSQMEEK